MSCFTWCFQAKLRILFEVAPLALLVEKAGGASSADGLCKSALDVDITEYDQRTQVCYGSIGEVRRFEEYLYGEWPRNQAPKLPADQAVGAGEAMKALMYVRVRDTCCSGC